MCQCKHCGEKKWSNRRKNVNKALSLIAINTCIWFVNIDAFTNWCSSRGVWTFENTITVVEDIHSMSESGDTSSPVTEELEGHTLVKAPKTSASSMSKTSPVIRAADVEATIHQVFGEEGNLAVAIAKAESSLRTDAKGFNCYYWFNSKRYSGACKPEDREKAWSVDCGVFQINVEGQDCPSELFNAEHNVSVAKTMSETKRGWAHWWTYNTGKYRKFLATSL